MKKQSKELVRAKSSLPKFKKNASLTLNSSEEKVNPEKQTKPIIEESKELEDSFFADQPEHDQNQEPRI